MHLARSIRARCSVATRTLALSIFALQGACAAYSPALRAMPASDIGTVSFSAGAMTTIRHPGLYPETILHRERTDTFLVSSMREGGVFEVHRDGSTRPLVRDARLVSVLGIAIDELNGRLWAVSGDLGVGVRASREGARKMAAVGIYDLSSGAPLAFVDLAPLHDGLHLPNGIALDGAGNAYVTDSLSPVIYRVDPLGQAQVFVEDARFSGDGINLNGIVVHPDGYLLVVKKSDGTLFKIPLDRPRAITAVATDTRFIGGDGLLLLADGRQLVLVANKVAGSASNAAFAIESSDGWASARVDAVQSIGDVYPTTATLCGKDLYVLHTKLNELLQAPAEQQRLLHAQATILSIGSVALAPTASVAAQR